MVKTSIRITAGGTAGLVEILLFHPLDVVKTRLQSQVKGAPDAYKGIGDVITRTIRNEGFTALYKGIKPPICAETPKRAIKFFVFGTLNQKLISEHKLSAPVAGSVAGLTSGLLEAAFVTPFERVKILLQTSKGSLKR